MKRGRTIRTNPLGAISNDNAEVIEDDGTDRSLFEKIARDFLEGGGSLPQSSKPRSDFPSALPPPNPFGSSLDELRGRSNPYEDDELMGVLRTHNRLRAEESMLASDENGDDDDDDGSDGMSPPPPLSLHDLITRTIEDDDKSDVITSSPTSGTDGPTGEGIPSTIDNGSTRPYTPLPNAWNDIPADMQSKIRKITTIASDIDGTILTSEQTVHPRTRSAILRAIDIVSPPFSTTPAPTPAPAPEGRNCLRHFFLATGKSRHGALAGLGTELSALIVERRIPGVYLQGLYCVDGEGDVVFERKLERGAISAVEDLLKEMEEQSEEGGAEVSVVGYDGDDLYTAEVTDIVLHLHEHYSEPLPRLLPHTTGSTDTPPRKLSTHTPSLHKLLLLSSNTVHLATTLRPRLERLAATLDPPCTVTQALPTMLELLPAGCGKAQGVSRLCIALGVEHPGEELLALGDAENDVGMLEMAGVGVAMGRSCWR